MFWPLRLSTFPVFWLAHLRQPYHDSLAPFSCSRSNVAQRCYSSRQRASLRPRTLFQPLRWKKGRPGGRGYACRKTLLDGRHCWGRTSKESFSTFLKLIILKMLPQCRVFLKICPFLPHFSRQNWRVIFEGFQSNIGFALTFILLLDV